MDFVLCSSGTLGDRHALCGVHRFRCRKRHLLLPGHETYLGHDSARRLDGADAHRHEAGGDLVFQTTLESLPVPLHDPYINRYSGTQTDGLDHFPGWQTPAENGVFFSLWKGYPKLGRTPPVMPELDH